MRIITFSGIRGGFNGTNHGEEIVQFARDFVAALPGTATPVYDGIEGHDHFISQVNWSKLIGEVGLATFLDGSPLLNEEASRVAPVAADAILQRTAATPGEPVVIIAHSQGTNNATFTVRHLLSHNAVFFT